MIRFKDFDTCRELTCWFTGVIGVRDPDGRWVGMMCGSHATLGVEQGRLRPAEPGVVQQVPSFRFITAC